MNSWIGVATLTARPKRTIAPFQASSSDGFPASKSLVIDAVVSAGSPL